MLPVWHGAPTFLPFLVPAILFKRTSCVRLDVDGCRVSRWHEWRTVCYGGRRRMTTTTTTFWKWLFLWRRSEAGEGPSMRQIFVSAPFCIPWSSRRELLPLSLLTGTFISKVEIIVGYWKALKECKPPDRAEAEMLKISVEFLQSNRVFLFFETYHFLKKIENLSLPSWMACCFSNRDQQTEQVKYTQWTIKNVIFYFSL